MDLLRATQISALREVTQTSLPAAFGGVPMFDERVPVANPSVADPEPVAADVAKILASGMLTNGPYVRRLEQEAAEYLGVRNCVAVSSCTAGLMLVMRASELSGDVVVPSFTFAATAHAVQWNGLRPVFAEVSPESLTLSADAARAACGVRTSAILATHLYGNPCDVEGLSEVARSNGIRLFFDAAHAFGSIHNGEHAGSFGDAEVFSLSPTKVLVAAEGGIIATNDDMLAERCRIGRDYGNPGDYDCLFVGLNARMSELHAAVALNSLADLEDRIAERNDLASLYRHQLEPVRGISFPVISPGDRSTYKDLTIQIDESVFGLDADGLADALRAEGIETRRYYSPPVHAMKAYRTFAGTNGRLAGTEAISRGVLSLPLWTGMGTARVRLISHSISRIGTFVRHARLQREASARRLVPAAIRTIR